MSVIAKERYVDTSSIIPDIQGIRFRKLRGESDYPKMLKVVQQSIDADGLERVVTLSDVINTYTYLSNFDPEKDLRIVEVEGVVVGYVRVNWNETIEGYLVYRHIANLLPEWRQKGIGTAMIRWAFARANDALLRVPENARVSINAYTIGSHKPSKRLLEDNGMKLFRHSWMMIINLEDEIPEPQWPGRHHPAPIRSRETR